MRDGEDVQVLAGPRVPGPVPAAPVPACPTGPATPVGHRSGRRRVLRALFAGGTAGVLVAAGWIAAGSPGSGPGGTAPGSPSAVRAGAAGTVGGDAAGLAPALGTALQTRATALLHRDRSAWLALTDPDVPAAARDQGTAFDRITGLPVSRWRYRVTGLTTVPAAGTYRAQVELVYRLDGDTRDVLRQRTMTVRSAAGHWLVRSDAAADAADRDLWDLGPLTVARGSRSVAVGLSGTPTVVAEVGSLADAAGGAVDGLWGTGWPRTVVVVLPADLAGMAAVLGRDDPSGLDRLAAVTSGPLDRGRGGPHAVAGAADRVVLNPEVWSRLTPVGRRVVLTHEITHVATRASTAATPPTWLDEGFAGYVGYRGSGLPAAVVAADALPDVRAGRLPARLPDAARFDPADGADPAPAYAQAWVACDLIARRAGPAGLVDVYRTAASAGGGEQRALLALRRVLGEDPAVFLDQWRAALRSLAAAPRTGG